MTRAGREKRLFVFLAALIVLLLFVKYGRYHVWPKRFATVEADQLYRSGQLESWPLERIIEEHGIRAILTLLADEPGDAAQQAEKRIAAEHDVEIIRIPMPGDGIAPLADLDRAADLVAEKSLRPMLVHCAAGVQRTGAVYAAWRIKHCDWSVDAAVEEAVAHGFDIDEHPEIRSHLEAYVAAPLGRATSAARD